MNTTRLTGTTVLSGGAVVSALTIAGAPWRVVAIGVVLAIVTPGAILFVQSVVPQDSEHKRDLWLAFMRFLERRRQRRRNGRSRE